MARVLAIHGVSNRSRPAFRSTVDRLAEAGGRSPSDFVDVFWGDLGPEAPLRSIPTRADADLVVPETARPSGAFPGGPTVAADDAQIVRIVQETITAVRATVTSPEPVPETTQRAVLDAVYDAAIAGSAAARSPEVAPLLAAVIVASPPAGSAVVDAGSGAFPHVSLTSALRSVIDRVDRIIGEWITDQFREHEAGLGGVLAHTIGDVLVYHSAGPVIRGRLDLAYRGARDLSDAPVDVVAHSLGALVVVDWLLGAPTEPPDGSVATPSAERRVRHLVTMGAQVSLFAELEGLATGAVHASPDGAVALPIALESWTNCWQGLDPLAFAMHRVIEIARPGGEPERVRDLCLAQQGVPRDLSFHSSYWTDPRFASLVATTFGG